MMGIIKLDITAQMRTTRTTMKIQAAITNNMYGSKRSRCRDK
jgi:hypothetical protein